MNNNNNQITAAITAVSGYVPETVLTNKDLEQMVDTSDEWITTRTGIKTRHILKEKGKATSDMAVVAIEKLLKKTNIAPEEIDMVICATVTPDMVFPSTSNIICDKAGLTEAWGYDISAACSGFLFALETGAQFITNGKHKKVLVCGFDK